MQEMMIPEAQQFALQQRQARAIFNSAFFPDLKSEAQAIAKVMAGAELGLSPFASITGMHIIQGNPVLKANTMATLIVKSGIYDYRIVRHDNEMCSITFYKIYKDKKEELGTSTFTKDEAQAAGLLGKDSWKKYPSDMLFARAISRGARRFTPGIFGGGTVYTPDELGADVDEDGVIINAPTIDTSKLPPNAGIPSLQDGMYKSTAMTIEQVPYDNKFMC